VTSWGEGLPALGLRVRFDDEDGDERKRGSQYNRLKRRVDAAGLVLVPHGIDVRLFLASALLIRGSPEMSSFGQRQIRRSGFSARDADAE
jgi:hypothetical protein